MSHEGEPASDKIVDLDRLIALRAELGRAGKTVVQCHGCFDIVHPGHVRYLRFARSQGDVLVVSVTADDVVGKGPDRPYVGEDLRLESLAALEAVDYVYLDREAWAGPVLEAVRPDVYVKGKEYERNAHPRFLQEKKLVEGYGGRVIFGSGDVIYSSTYILSQFRDRFGLEQDKITGYCRRHDLDRGAVDALLAGCVGRRVLVLADPILDSYVHCDAAGIAAETPILSVTPIREDWYVGAGGLIAGQIVALGGEATFLTVLGGGSQADTFADRLRATGAALSAVETDDRPVFTKTRYLVDERKVFKVDRGFSSPLSTAASRALIEALERALPDHDALLVTDFGYGLFTSEVTDAVARVSAALGKPYYADVSSRRASVRKFQRPRLVTPTEEELRFAFADNEAGISNLAARYYQETGGVRLVVTLGKRGVLVFGPLEGSGGRLKTDYLPAMATHVVDPVGAGDVYLAATTLADLAGATVEQGAYLASLAAALHVSRLGNDPVSGGDLAELVASRPELDAGASMSRARR